MHLRDVDCERLPWSEPLVIISYQHDGNLMCPSTQIVEAKLSRGCGNDRSTINLVVQVPLPRLRLLVYRRRINKLDPQHFDFHCGRLILELFLWID